MNKRRQAWGTKKATPTGSSLSRYPSRYATHRLLQSWKMTWVSRCMCPLLRCRIQLHIDNSYSKSLEQIAPCSRQPPFLAHVNSQMLRVVLNKNHNLIPRTLRCHQLISQCYLYFRAGGILPKSSMLFSI